jgi:hypothetical protein
MTDGVMHTCYKDGTEYNVPYFCINGNFNVEWEQIRIKDAIEPNETSKMVLKIKYSADQTI